MSVKHKMRMEQVARMRFSGLKDATIAAAVGLTQAGLATLVYGDDYKELELSVMTGKISELDKAFAGKTEALKAEARTLVPCALRTIAEAINQRRDLKTALAAATLAIKMDPDRTFQPDSVAMTPTAPSVPKDLLASIAGEADKLASQRVN